MGDKEIIRCPWPGDDPFYQQYHDDEWGRPVVDDRRLFEKICLEGFQSGLSWITILRKRERFREVFLDFDFDRISLFNDADIDRLLKDAGIIRHAGKIKATINNAARAQEMRAEFGALSAYFWRFEPEIAPGASGKDWEQLKAVSITEESTALSKDLKKRGWKFVGPTTCYAFMQAMGMVNDHTRTCFAHAEVEKLRADMERPTLGQ